jgi:LEM3 (ligand-effect modulator 3) family / CDC50 family
MEVSKPNKPPNTDFAQQRLRGFSLSPSPILLGIIYLLLGLGFTGMGVLYYLESESITEVVKRYDDIYQCQANWKVPQSCMIELNLTNHVYPPIFIYYEISNMYQNHRKYSKSRDIYQLMGSDRSTDDLSSSCFPVIDMEDLGFYNSLPLNKADPANPCGLVSLSLFNDTFSLLPPQDSLKETIDIKFDHLAWDIDKEEKYKRNPNWQDLQWTDVENEHFMVWMSIAGLPTFRKLWGRIEEELEPGVYRIAILNNYDVVPFKGEKRMVMTTSSIFGGKFYFLAYSYMACAVIAFIGSALVFIMHRMKSKLHY